MAAPDFWNDQNAAKLVIDQANAQRAVLNPFKAVSGRLEDVRILVELAEMEADAAARGVQLFSERVLDPAAGGSRVLIATIEEGSPTPPAEVSQEALKFGE